MIIFIDSSVLEQLCNPNSTDDLAALENWFERSLIRCTFVTSMVCDYEVRRGLLLTRKQGLIAFTWIRSRLCISDLL
jgi:hypothetical protein